LTTPQGATFDSEWIMECLQELLLDLLWWIRR